MDKRLKYLLLMLLLILGCSGKAYSDCTANDGTPGVVLWARCWSIENTTELDVYNAGLKGAIPSTIGSLTNLTYLALSYNQLTG